MTLIKADPSLINSGYVDFMAQLGYAVSAVESNGTVYIDYSEWEKSKLDDTPEIIIICKMAEESIRNLCDFFINSDDFKRLEKYGINKTRL